MLRAKGQGRGPFCPSILLSHSCPCCWRPAHSKRPSQGCDRPLQKLLPPLAHRLSGADIASDHPERQRRDSAPSRNCERLELENVAGPGEAVGPNTNRKGQTA